MVDTDNSEVIIDQAVHELRNIFTILIGNLEMLRDSPDGSTDKLVARALSSTDRFEAVISSLITLGSRGKAKN